MRIRVFVCLLAALLAATPALAAGPVLSGKVSDATGAPLPATRVVVRDIATGVERTVETGADGRYQIELTT